MNYGKHEEALSYLSGIREERGLLSAFIFTMGERYEIDGAGTRGAFLYRIICFFNRGIKHDD